mmetsp:Transcript_32173/g.77792  ORF Transcript_32173/g.77792 Transcript_32173/m.77792 type:complete len:469 (-) Transcript_32173:2054-3460(-)
MGKLLKVELRSSLGHLHGIGVSRSSDGAVEHANFSIIRVGAAGLEATTNGLLDLHDGKHNHHGRGGESPSQSVHGLHAKDEGVQSGNVRAHDLEDGDDDTGRQRGGVAPEDLGGDGAVVREPGAEHDGHGAEIEYVEGGGPNLEEGFLRVVLVAHGGSVVVLEGSGVRRVDDDGRSDDAPGQEDGSEDDAKEEITSDESLPDASGGECHDAILGGLDGGDEPERNRADKVGVQDLDGGNGSIGQPGEQSHQHGHALRVVDGGVHEEDLTEVVPHDATLLHGVNDGGKVVVRQNHLGRLPRDVGPLLPHGDSHIRRLERGCVVHTVARHARNLSHGLQRLHDANLVLGTRPRKDVVRHDRLHELLVAVGVELRPRHGLAELLVDDSEHVSDGGGRVLVIPRDHGDAYPGAVRLPDGLDALGTGGVHDRAQSDHGEPLALGTARDELGTELLGESDGILVDVGAAQSQNA